MTYGTSANPYLSGRQTVPFVTGPAEQNRSNRQKTADPATHQGKMAK